MHIIKSSKLDSHQLRNSKNCLGHILSRGTRSTLHHISHRYFGWFQSLKFNTRFIPLYTIMSVFSIFSVSKRLFNVVVQRLLRNKHFKWQTCHLSYNRKSKTRLVYSLSLNIMNKWRHISTKTYKQNKRVQNALIYNQTTVKMIRSNVDFFRGGLTLDAVIKRHEINWSSQSLRYFAAYIVLDFKIYQTI